MARIAHGFGMKVIACRKNREKGNEGLDFVDIVDFDYLLEESDIVSILLPLIKHGSYRTEGLNRKERTGEDRRRRAWMADKYFPG